VTAGAAAAFDVMSASSAGGAGGSKIGWFPPPIELDMRPATKSRFRTLLAVAALAAVPVVAGLAGCSERSAAPTFQYVKLDGQAADTASLKGKVVLVNFWATSCTTCVHEMPQIVATHQMFKDKGFETVAVAMSYDAPAYVSNFAESRHLPFDVAIDNTGAIASKFGDIRLTPTTILIDKHGDVVKRYVGEPNFDDLHALIGKLLAEA
jgi:peroxiredoxin